MTLFLTLGASLMALVIAIVSLAFQLRAGSVHELQSKVRSIDADVTDLAERLNTWQRRDSVRKARDAKEPMPVEIPSLGDRKSQLRARARAMFANGGRTA